MKLHLNFSQSNHLGTPISKTVFLPSSDLQTKKFAVTDKNEINKIVLNKLKPQHWFDNVWKNLEINIDIL